MTDKEKLETLLTEWGVPFATATENAVNGSGTVIFIGHHPDHPAQDSLKVHGDPGVFAEFCFDADGTFEMTGVWK